MHQLLTDDPATDAGRDSKVMSAADAVARFVAPGSVIGLGGQNINRCPMALVHEVVRQRPSGLTIVGCNLSLPMDVLVAAGLVTRTEQGSGNLEKYGVLFTWRRQLESGQIATADHSHLTMASRFLAGAMGAPFMVTRSLLGSSLLTELVTQDLAVAMPDPWTGESVVLLRALRPDVSLIHVSRADPEGNAVIDGVTSHEIDMVRASKSTIVSAEQVVPLGSFDHEPERVTISSAYVSAVVEQPYGAYPTSVYRSYDYCEAEVEAYQRAARAGGPAIEAWLADNVTKHTTFDEYLSARDPHGVIRGALEEQMASLL